MRTGMLRIVGATLTVLVLAACTPTTLSGGPSDGHLRAESAARTPGAIPQPVQNIASLPRPKAVGKTETYSVVVNNVRVQDLLFALARDAKINVDIHPGITGYVTLNAIDQTLPQLLTRIAKQVDMRFELDGPNLAVMPDTPYLKSYAIDYINIARDVTGTVSTNTQISTSALATTGGGGATGAGNTSRIQIENKSRNRFWESLEKNVKDLLHETDKIFPEGSTETVLEQNTTQSTTGTGARAPTVSAARGSQVNPTLAGSPNPAALQNSGETVVRRMTFREAASVIASPETGVLTVRATARQHEKVQEFIDRVMHSAKKQVLIEATIVEVALSDTYQQGIDWKNISTTGFAMTRATNTTNVGSTTTPFGMVYRNATAGLSIAVDMLRGFGTTKVLSSPKLTVLNNQTATLKVSEDFVYFNVKQDIAAGNINSNALTTTTTTPQSVSIGFFMSLTAQVGDDDMVTLNVRPSISSISELKEDPNPALKESGVKNFVPQIRTREIESMLRVQSGDIAVLGGLMEDRMDNKNGRFPGLGNVPFFGEIFTTRNNASSKSELVIILRPTVIRDASINGDFSQFARSLPDRDFFNTDEVYKPFSPPNAQQEPLR
jgi:MSHA type pilus biogenesis protein MshL